MAELLDDLGIGDDDRHRHGETVYSLCDRPSGGGNDGQ